MKNIVVAISGDSMGKGSEDLGKILVKGFIRTLAEQDTAPSAIIFFNSGAHLTAKGSNALDDLKQLEEKGAEILTCGTCIDYYELDKQPEAGSVTNMYEISKRLLSADSVVNI
ncbi:MAG: sulfurtransferase-like selenium metabolism protein YedF [Defluviitaleaceae bacterium]|nr:sulfurtransferase-like selenium metabolism protein YedF [Defluviitaleaceae bacterium]